MAKNSYQKNSQSEKKWGSFWVGLIAFIVVAAILAGVIGWRTSGFKDWTFGFGNTETKQPEDKDPIEGEDENNGNSVIGGVDNNGITLTAAKLPREAFEANGVSPYAESAHVLTATLSPDNASDKTVDWRVEWIDPEEGFAKGKTVTDYVTVTPTSDGALTARAECLREFGAKIQIIVQSRVVSSVRAVCTVDYERKLNYSTFNLTCTENADCSLSLSENNAGVINWKFLPYIGDGDTTLYHWGRYNNEFTDTLSETYTINCNVVSHSIEVSASSELKAYLDSITTINSVYRDYYRRAYTYQGNGSDIFSQRKIIGTYVDGFDGIFKFWLETYSDDSDYDDFTTENYQDVSTALKACSVDFNITVKATLSNGQTYSRVYKINVLDSSLVSVANNIYIQPNIKF